MGYNIRVTALNDLSQKIKKIKHCNGAKPLNAVFKNVSLYMYGTKYLRIN